MIILYLKTDCVNIALVRMLYKMIYRDMLLVFRCSESYTKYMDLIT
jgi:hypothetical protein